MIHTAKQLRDKVRNISKGDNNITMIDKDAVMSGLWEQYKKRNYFVGDLEWKEVLNGVLNVIYACY